MSQRSVLFRRALRGRESERPRLLVAGLLYLAFALATALLAWAGGPGDARAQAPAASPAAAPAALYFRKAGPAPAEPPAGTAEAPPAFAAPLLHAEVEIAVHGPIERTTVRQYFLNPSEDWMEGTYVFPLPEGAAVDRLTMIVGERRIEGEIRERQEAREAYEQARAEGRHASLLSSERPNVFTTAVANIGPRQAVAVEIAYQQRLRYDSGRYELRFPLVVAPRYSPGAPALVAVPMPARPGAPRTAERPLPAAVREAVPEQTVPESGAAGARPAATPLQRAERGDLFGPVVDPASGELVPTAAIEVRLDAGLPLAHIESPSHAIEVESLPGGGQRVALARGPVDAERDFVLRWTPAVGAAPEAALFGEEVGGDSFLLASLLPGAAEAPAAQRPRDLILVVDTSGSMFGPSMEQAKAAVELALQRLKPGERVNVIRFDDETEALFEHARPVDEATLQQAERFVEGLQADGGTEMLPALEAALGEAAEPGRLTQIVFVTDGAVANEQQLFEALHRGLGERRLFTVGIGSAPNSWFMTKAAELGRGSFTFIGSAGEVEARMGALFRKLEHPALTDLTAEWRGADGEPLAGVEAAPARLPDLYLGEPVQLAARVPGRPLDRLSGSLLLRGERGGEPWQARLPLSGLESDEGVSAIWARARLDEMESGLARGRPESEVRAEALPLALGHRLVTRWTSLVAIDRGEVARPEGAAAGSAAVARALPYGWSYEAVFGASGEAAGDRRLGAEQARLRRALALRPVSPDELRRAGVAEAASVALPQTATDAGWRALVGVLALLAGLMLILGVRRSRWRPAGRRGGGPGAAR